MGLANDPQHPSQDQKKLNRSDDNSFMKYSGLAIQLLGSIALFGWLGHLLDSYLSFQFPVFMLLLGFLAFAGMMVQLYKSVNK